jgi:tetratricopeptide (TPR) repeat protein
LVYDSVLVNRQIQVIMTLKGRVSAIIFMLALCLLSYFGNAQNTAIDFLRYAVEATEKKDYAGAIVLCDRSIALDNRNELAYYHRAFNKSLLGDFNGAIEDATKSIELNDQIADTYLLRAEANLKIGARFSAISDYNRARRLDGSITVAHMAQNLFNAIF